MLADGAKVDGPAALRDAILSRPDAFVTTLTERMLTYALGRGLEPSDMPVVRRIVKKAAQNDYRFASIIIGIVESAPFQMRTTLEPAETVNRVAQAKGTVAMIITKKHLSRRTFLRGAFGATMALPLLDAMVPALDGAVADGGELAVPVRRHLHAVRRLSRHVASGRRPAATSSSSRSCSRSSRSAISSSRSAR